MTEEASGFGDRKLLSADAYAQAYCNDDEVGDQEIMFQGTRYIHIHMAGR